MKPVFMSLFLVAALAAFSLQAQPAKEEPKIAAIINGEIITVDRVSELYDQLSPQMHESYERAGGKITFLQKYLIAKRLVLQEAAKTNFAQKPEVQSRVIEARDAVVYDQYIRQVVGASVVSEGDMRAYYEAHKSEFSEPEMVKARHIIVTPTEGTGVVNATQNDAKSPEAASMKIQMIAAQLARGASFNELATQLSEDGSASLGGDLGWFPREKMVAAFDAVAFSLEKGKISPIVETEFGYHIVKVEDRRAARVRPLSEVHELVRDRLLTEHGEQVLAEVNSLTMQLRAASRVSVYPENF